MAHPEYVGGTISSHLEYLLDQRPIKWMERLLDVNARSDFTSAQKIVIAAGLRTILKQLGSDVATVR